MKNKSFPLLLAITAAIYFLIAVESPAKTRILQYQDQRSSASVQPARMNGQPGIAVVFEGTDDLHYYATASAAPAPHLLLRISAKADGLTFGDTVYPEYHYFDDPAKGKIEVYVGNFTVFIPMTKAERREPPDGAVENAGAESVGLRRRVLVTIKGIACTSELCLSPFTKTIAAEVNLSQMDAWPQIDFKTAPPPETPTTKPKTEIGRAHV